MNILLIGGGGREHALARKLAESKHCDELYIAPGNAGTSQHGDNILIKDDQIPELADFCLGYQIDMVVPGPEAPLVAGIYDFIKEHKEYSHTMVIGPSKQGAMLEGSKSFAKEFMGRHNIPTAAYREFNASSLQEGLAYIDSQQPPIVLKADGLAGGKGVVIAQSLDEAKEELKAMIGEAKFGEASAKVVIEQFLDGVEFSVFVLSDGEHYQILPTAKDYKRIGEGDTGLNTGGMGAISPVPFVDDQLMQKVEERIVKPTVDGLRSEGITYKGFIYCGLILVDGEPYVIEYNCRMGDPETEVVMPRLESDLVELFMAIDKGSLHQYPVNIDPRAAATVMLVSGGYPGSYEKGKAISGLENVKDSFVYHAGTKADGEQVVTNGGRVMAVTAFGPDVQAALRQCYADAERIQFEGKYYRKDIGYEFK